MTEGLENIKYAVLRQEVDQLEWCLITMPIPCNIGIPCQPCDLPNTFHLFQSNDTYQQLGMKIWELNEESTCFHRQVCYPSLRPFKINSKDFYSEIPVTAEKPLRIPLFSPNLPEMTVRYKGEYAGKIVEPRDQQLFKGMFHILKILDVEDKLMYEIRASLTLGMCLWVPEKYAPPITYEIVDENGNVDGEIRHLHYGFANELCSKADQYGLTYPQAASEKQKALITMAALMIDYQWFENF